MYPFNLDFIRCRISAEDAMSAARLRANVILPSASMKTMAQVRREHNESREAFQKRRNAVYARRVYQRHQTKLTSLQRQHDYLQVTNVELKDDKCAIGKFIAASISHVCHVKSLCCTRQETSPTLDVVMIGCDALIQ